MNSIKKLFTMTVLLSIMMPATGNAQNFKNDVENLGKSLNELKEATNELFSLFKKKDRSVASDAATSSGVQQGGFRIVTGHPDFKIRVLRCETSGSTCVIDIVLTNTGSSDVKVDLCGGYWRDASIAYDDEGNTYQSDRFLVGYGSSSPRQSGYEFVLPAGVPIKAKIQIEGLASSATYFPRLDLVANCETWGLNYYRGKVVHMYNIPISREGD